MKSIKNFYNQTSWFRFVVGFFLPLVFGGIFVSAIKYPTVAIFVLVVGVFSICAAIGMMLKEDGDL